MTRMFSTISKFLSGHSATYGIFVYELWRPFLSLEKTFLYTQKQLTEFNKTLGYPPYNLNRCQHFFSRDCSLNLWQHGKLLSPQIIIFSSRQNKTFFTLQRDIIALIEKHRKCFAAIFNTQFLVTGLSQAQT